MNMGVVKEGLDAGVAAGGGALPLWCPPPEAGCMPEQASGAFDFS